MRRGLRTARLEAFSDGVFAIAVTLLVLDLVIPAGAVAHLLRSVGELWPSYLAYVVSFATIGSMWLGHNAITEYLERVDAGFVRLNMLLLLMISFLPFPTRMFAIFIGHNSAERVAVTIYGLTLFLASGLLWVLWHYAIRAHLVRPDADDEEVRLLTKRLTPAWRPIWSWSSPGCSCRLPPSAGTWPLPCTTSFRSGVATRHSTAVSASRTGDGIAAERLRPWLPRCGASRSAWLAAGAGVNLNFGGLEGEPHLAAGAQR
jgi:uncharacterized membrane protein